MYTFICLFKSQYILLLKELPAEMFWKSDVQQQKLLVIYEEEKPSEEKFVKSAIIVKGLNEDKNDLYFAMNEQKVNMLRRLTFK